MAFGYYQQIPVLRFLDSEGQMLIFISDVLMMGVAQIKAKCRWHMWKEGEELNNIILHCA